MIVRIGGFAGDWQLLAWLLPTVPVLGGTEKNPLTGLDRFRILDNLRRSVMPVLLTALFVWSFFSGGTAAVSAWIAIASIGSMLLLDACDLLWRSRFTRQKYHSFLISGVTGALLRLLLRLVLLPYGAYTAICAIATSLGRMLTGKNMLRWVTAAESEGRGRNDLWYYLRRMWFAVVLGAACVLTLRVLPAAVGGIWMLSPVVAYLLSRPINYTQSLSPTERTYLTQQAERMYGYFREHLTQQNHYLPPDNVQFRPQVPPAYRTSPTNIGLALLSVVAAVDLGLESRRQAIELLSNMLETIERLPKWHGHLYNWYTLDERCAGAGVGYLRWIVETLQHACWYWNLF